MAGRKGVLGPRTSIVLSSTVCASTECEPPAMCRTLPIRLTPAVGEALDSYLEALAYRSHTAWGDVVGAVGLGESTMRSGIYGWLMRLTRSQSSALSRATGIDATRLDSMTVAGLTSGASATSGPCAPAPILRAPARSRYCPQCLADSGGRWLLWWRLRWAIACPTHQCLLADCCPACGCWQRVGAPSSDTRAAPGFCPRRAVTSHAGKQSWCGGDLSDSAVPHFAADHPVLIAQQRILRCLTQQSVSEGIYVRGPVDVPQFLADMSAIANRVLRNSPADIITRHIPMDRIDPNARRRQGDARRPSADNAMALAATAFATVSALAILDSADAHAAGAQMRWMLTAPRAPTTVVTPTQFGKGKKVSSALRAAQLSALETYLGPSDQLRYRVGTPWPCDPQESAERHRHVPGLLWFQATLRLTKVGPATEQLAAALACAVVAVGTRITLANAATRLGSVTTPPSISRILQKLSTAKNWQAMRAALIRLADAVDSGACPIDYERRRALPYSDLLVGDEWHEICCDLTGLADSAMSLQLVTCWMYEQMTGSPARLCPAAGRTAEFRQKLTELRQARTPSSTASLGRSAKQFLERHGCGAEPLCWHPPSTLLAL
ncbi:hypothetical protein K875_04181 [Mycobacterium [tuberculosis] TKK-01-0051]|uniref:TniQ domain-containing protein n=1 Tax=Mycobacterium [tuberculosis] TKK-01-0051 TaxID=1324261 RepID=A0A051TWM9_9MYCO|nr:hypothetical protein K875_04181 [Mycobacterium [tuberculosis] TKK-01-0051]